MRSICPRHRWLSNKQKTVKFIIERIHFSRAPILREFALCVSHFCRHICLCNANEILAWMTFRAISTEWKSSSATAIVRPMSHGLYFNNSCSLAAMLLRVRWCDTDIHCMKNSNRIIRFNSHSASNQCAQRIHRRTLHILQFLFPIRRNDIENAGEKKEKLHI